MMSMANNAYSSVTKSAQEAIRPYLQDKDKLINIAKNLQETHYQLLTTHADLAHTIQSASAQIKGKREEAQKVLSQYEEHKAKLADMVDSAVGKSTELLKCTPGDLQCKMDQVNALAGEIKGANEHITGLLTKVEQKSTQLRDVINTKQENTVLSQLIQSQIQTLAK